MDKRSGKLSILEILFKERKSLLEFDTVTDVPKIDKHLKELPILERMAKYQQLCAKNDIVIGIPMLLLFGIPIILSLNDEKNILSAVLIWLIISEAVVKKSQTGAKRGVVVGVAVVLLSGIPAIVYLAPKLAVLVVPYIGVTAVRIVFNHYSIQKVKTNSTEKDKTYSIVTGITKMRSDLGVATDEEFEDILENCKRITYNVFMDNRYIINFDTNTVTNLADITSCTTYKANGLHCPVYGIIVNVRNGKSDNIKFIREIARDKAYKIITTTAEFAEGQKYIN